MTDQGHCSYKQIEEHLYSKYKQIPFHQLRSLAKGEGLLPARNKYGEPVRDAYDIRDLLINKDLSKIPDKYTHTLTPYRWFPYWEGNSWGRTDFMDLFGDDDSRFGDGSQRAQEFKELNSWAPQEVLDHICDIFLWERKAQCTSVSYLTDCEEDEPDDPPPRITKDPGNRITASYAMSPALMDLETQTLHPPQWTEELSNHETKQLNGTIYRCSWMFDDKVFYESSIQIDESGDHTFKSPWKCL